MKIEKIYDHYKVAEKNFCCPLCHSKMKVRRPANLTCKKGHCFNIAKQGYINFLPHQQETKYTQDLFESRRIILEQGFYKPLEECLESLIKECFPERENLQILDAGCGEGFYARQMSQVFPEAEIYGFDNAKEAVVMAAKKSGQLRWFVGDLTNMPLQPESIDVILDIFTPSNYGEFLRVLRKEGYLLKVIPGEGYLKELRACIDKDWRKGAYSSQPVITYFSDHMELCSQREVHYTKTVDRAAAEEFVKMTPMMFDVAASSVNIENLERLTFAFTVLIGKMKRKGAKRT